MDALTVLIIAVVVFAVFVLLTAYALKMAVIMGRESRKARQNSIDNEPGSVEENEDHESASSK